MNRYNLIVKKFAGKIVCAVMLVAAAIAAQSTKLHGETGKNAKMKNFYDVLKIKLKKRGIKLKDFYDKKSVVEQTILAEYGSVFMTGNGSVAAPRVVFVNGLEVNLFQQTLSISRQTIGGFDLELQTSAMNDLIAAIAEAETENLTINPRGADSARRDYAGTVELWASRVNPALEFWTNEGKIAAEQADKIRGLQPFEQVPEIFKLEKDGIFFSKDLSKPIIYSVAPPGTSQHLSLLAFDVAEYKNENVRRILAAHGWFQTVVSDLPHFTYLGADEKALSKLGLKKIESESQIFWTPNI